MFLDFPISATALWWSLGAGLCLVALLLVPRVRAMLFGSHWWWLALGILLVTGMLFLPSENHLLGDGLTHLGNTDRWFSPTEPLDVFLHQLVGQVTGSLLISYRLLAWLAGIFYLLGLYLMSRLAAAPHERTIVVFSFLATATLQFYFGYVESYTLLNLFTLYFLYFAWRDLRAHHLSKLPLLFFVLAVLSHFSGMALLPGLLFLYRRNLGRGMLYLLGVLLLAALAAAYLVDIRIIAVPPVATDFSTYTLLSNAHLFDLAQLILLITPAFWLTIFSRRFDSQVRFALFALGGTLLFTLLVDPKIGALRDWDLLSIYALPLCLLVALRAPRHVLTSIVLVLIIALRIAPWIAFNSQPQVEFMKEAIAGDLHYSKHYDNGQRLSSWGFLLTSAGDLEGAEAVYIERLKYKPHDLKVLNMLVPVEFKLGKFGEAHRHCLQALAFQPRHQDFRYKAMYTAFRLGDLEAAIRLGANSPPDFWNSDHVKRLYAGVLAVQEKHEEAIAEAKQVATQDIDGYLPWLLSHSAALIGDTLYARRMAVAALELDEKNNEYRAWLDSLSTLDSHE
jgi:hypothetical protein